jgi:hypothetical protein
MTAELFADYIADLQPTGRDIDRWSPRPPQRVKRCSLAYRIASFSMTNAELSGPRCPLELGFNRTKEHRRRQCDTPVPESRTVRR